jgi:hypothetical protein
MESRSRTSRSIIALGCVLICWTVSSPAGQGRDARCYLTNGDTLAGELLSVRDNGVIIRLESGENGNGPETDENSLRLIGAGELDSIVFEAEPDYGTIGAFAGLVAGVTLAAVTVDALSSEISTGSTSAACAQSVGLVVGGAAIACGMVALGGAIGRSGSVEEEIYRVGGPVDWDSLKQYSRFGGNEPPYVRKLFPIP